MTLENSIFQKNHVDRQTRSSLKGHQPLVLWMTGLSGSGKSTIANLLESRLVSEFKAHTYLLDGDIIRQGLNTGLGFSIEDRKENIRRVGEATKILYDAGLIVITAFISPIRSDRDLVRSLFPREAFWEVFISCPLTVCQKRDPKGLYQKALTGEIPEFTGISSPYEVPLKPEITIASEKRSAEECVEQIIQLMVKKKILTLTR